jgi:hypothetical protein
MKRFLVILMLLLPSFAQAQIIPTLPVTLTNGSLADANQVMSNFNTIVTGTNTNGAKNGANNDITALGALTTPLTPTQGGSSVYSGADAGSANAYLVTTPVPINFTLRSGNTVNFIPSFTNTGPSTLATAGTTATAILRQTNAGLVPLVGGEIFTGQIATVIYDGTQYELINSAVAANTQPCTSIDYAGITVPTGYLAENGQAVSRATFPTLLACMTISVAATLNGTTTVTVPNSALMQVGWFVGGSNVTCNSTINSIPGGGTTIVISNAAGAGGASTLTIGPQPLGDCATTFNVPNYQGRATVMADGSGSVLTATTCTNPASIGTTCGAQTETLTLAQLPGGITSAGTVTDNTGLDYVASTNGAGITSFSLNAGGSTVFKAFSNGTNATDHTGGTSTGTFTSNNTGGASHPIVQPIGLVTKAIKF